MEWFKCMDKFNENQKDAWNHDDSMLIDLEAWRNRESLANHLESTYVNLSIGERKRIKKNIKRFMDEVDDFIMQIGNETFHGSPKHYKEDTIKNLETLWIKACKAYFNNDDGKALYSRTQHNKNPKSTNAIIPFGPWVIWKEDGWEDIYYGYGRWKKIQKTNKSADNSGGVTKIRKSRGTPCVPPPSSPPPPPLHIHA